MKNANLQLQMQRYQRPVYIGMLTATVLGSATFCGVYDIFAQKSLSSYCVDQNEKKTRSIRPFVLFATALLCFKGYERVMFLIAFSFVYFATFLLILLLSKSC